MSASSARPTMTRQGRGKRMTAPAALPSTIVRVRMALMSTQGVLTELRHSASHATLRLSGGLLAVDFPRDAKLVSQHAESRRPESLLKRHLHRSVFREGFEHPLAFHRIIDAD